MFRSTHNNASVASTTYSTKKQQLIKLDIKSEGSGKKTKVFTFYDAIISNYAVTTIYFTTITDTFNNIIHITNTTCWNATVNSHVTNTACYNTITTKHIQHYLPQYQHHLLKSHLSQKAIRERPASITNIVHAVISTYYFTFHVHIQRERLIIDLVLLWRSLLNKSNYPPCQEKDPEDVDSDKKAFNKAPGHMQPSSTKNGYNLCAQRWLKCINKNGMVEEFRVYYGSLTNAQREAYDAEVK
ncbi:hypothetical protein F5I97DRAFT_1828720 [Phlebopus sp. FC_14]|nr:hypothetical protein F5I97DRAFT_1828720 [Phlebopus sp. FC_14]